ncbi:Cell wall-active antibiotics response 4TMS YvqF [Lentzea xinjiangensis]|uniref:Cell wall-active antibiotics response 4TMS YvqF n=1 Tax=Lentzea xinjiangensis TaxID=402600 RepID=A0A1H9BWX9_9PSEU|nr:DUF1707 domain-containing protein [Lentzea xinjiangensis]SEP93496.1 Cell wall-active antibiotics response 4TMS YvqF [Lentzea xinjiangensis]
MSDELLPADQSHLRASDADRERVAQVLHRATAEGRLDIHELDERLIAVYAAKTYGELVPITADLVLSGLPQTPAMPQHQPATDDRVGGEPGSAVSVAFWSGVNRKGQWVVPRMHNAVAVMGGIEIDLTHARFAEREVTISCFAFWGGVEIRVPDDINVNVDGFGFMGAFEDRAPSRRHIPGAPTVRITGLAIMGGVEVKGPKKKKSQILRELLE